MANTIFEVTYSATQQITATIDMVWAIDAGLCNLRQDATEYLTEHPNASNQDAKNALIKGKSIHRINLKKIAMGFSWEYEEQYIAELLLINGIAIFDTWIDGFVDVALISKSKKKKEQIASDVKQGVFSSLENALANEATSALAGSFQYTAKRQDSYIANLQLVYKYFKSCRNCCAHGNRKFNRISETNYNAIKLLTKDDCGVKEFPKIAETKKGEPIKIILRGVVGFYDVLMRIINHYDIIAADTIAVNHELLRRWKNISSPKLSDNISKRINSIPLYLQSVNMCPR